MLKILQSRGNGVERGRNNQFPASLKTLTPQQAVRGTLLYLPKSAVTPVLRRNIYLDTNHGNIEIPEHLNKPMDLISGLLKLNKDDGVDYSDLEDLEEEYN